MNALYVQFSYVGKYGRDCAYACCFEVKSYLSVHVQCLFNIKFLFFLI